MVREELKEMKRRRKGILPRKGWEQGPIEDGKKTSLSGSKILAKTNAQKISA